MAVLTKRTFCYVQPPEHFQVAPCQTCGDYRFLKWSEYQGHLWCPDCKKDFIPKHFGILDGPVLVNTSRILGIDFRIYDIVTGKLIEEETSNEIK